MARLGTVERESLPEDQRRFHDAVKAIRRRPITGPFIVTMNSSPDLAARFAHLGHYFHARGQVDESIVSIRVRSFISLIGSRALDAPYEWAAWVNWALEAGVPQDTVDAIRAGETPSNLTPEEKLVTDICTQMISANHRVSDATFNAALDHFGTQRLVELVVTLGYFAMIALPLNAFEIQMSSAQHAQRKSFAPLEVFGEPWGSSGRVQRSLPAISVSGPGRARVPLLSTHDDLAPGDQHFLDRVIRTRGWISPAFGLLLHTPDVAERVAAIGEFFLYETILPPAPKALAWLITARELDCNYAWASGVTAARAAGIDAQLIESIEHGGGPAPVTEEQQAVVDFCYQLLRGNHHVSDAAYEAVVSRLGLQKTVQISTAVGYIAMMSLIVNPFEIPAVTDKTKPAL
jgi:4-carboxymuconolactone decarboxylase